ncbi:MAG TPA: orotate phosphoribosyltransferase [Flavobacteriaceae bacterium]|nr:orotate phosphoribosyltransferase [Flavobacteriaceae bacterium]|tara:strand:+ start:1080 stop:1724 length:645 start_codon:yes stop_codon:yes gene_type:complete
MDETEFNNFQEETAKILLDINAIKLNPNEPFTWASGWKSPIYCDNRIILSNPEIRNTIKKYLAKVMGENFEKPDAIAGVATGAIGIGMLVADYLDLPFIYVRPEAKKHGRKNQIEGDIEKEKKVMVVEDLISTGKSSIGAIRALKSYGLNVLGMIAIFTYEFSVSKDNFNKEKVKFKTLSNYSTLLRIAQKTKYISDVEFEIIEKWNVNPSTWS